MSLYKRSLFKILILLIITSSIGCSQTKKAPNQVSSNWQKNNITREKKDINKLNKITVAQLMSKYIPTPPNGREKDNYIKFYGKWKGEVMPSLLNEMKKAGWIEYERYGAMQFFAKKIGKDIVQISLVPSEKSDINEKVVSTFVSLEIVKQYTQDSRLTGLKIERKE